MHDSRRLDRILVLDRSRFVFHITGRRLQPKRVLGAKHGAHLADTAHLPAIAVFNAMLFTVWGTYRKRIFPELHRAVSRGVPNNEITAAKFAITDTQVHEVQDSQVTVIHHRDDGEIAAVITDKSRIPPVSNADYFDAAHIA